MLVRSRGLKRSAYFLSARDNRRGNHDSNASFYSRPLPLLCPWPAQINYYTPLRLAMARPFRNAAGGARHRRKDFFFEKKKQKTFTNCVQWAFQDGQAGAALNV
jgi:hypothetical protein